MGTQSRRVTKMVTATSQTIVVRPEVSVSIDANVGDDMRMNFVCLPEVSHVLPVTTFVFQQRSAGADPNPEPGVTHAHRDPPDPDPGQLVPPAGPAN